MFFFSTGWCSLSSLSSVCLVGLSLSSAAHEAHTGVCHQWYFYLRTLHTIQPALGTTPPRPLARYCMWYSNNFCLHHFQYRLILLAVCDLPASRQEQMPVEESGNMVTTPPLSLPLSPITSCNPDKTTLYIHALFRFSWLLGVYILVQARTSPG